MAFDPECHMGIYFLYRLWHFEVHTQDLFLLKLNSQLENCFIRVQKAFLQSWGSTGREWALTLVPTSQGTPTATWLWPLSPLAWIAAIVLIGLSDSCLFQICFPHCSQIWSCLSLPSEHLKSLRIKFKIINVAEESPGALSCCLSALWSPLQLCWDTCDAQNLICVFLPPALCTFYALCPNC